MAALDIFRKTDDIVESRIRSQWSQKLAVNNLDEHTVGKTLRCSEYIDSEMRKSEGKTEQEVPGGSGESPLLIARTILDDAQGNGTSIFHRLVGGSKGKKRGQKAIDGDK